MLDRIAGQSANQRLAVLVILAGLRRHVDVAPRMQGANRFTAPGRRSGSGLRHAHFLR
jgi:hypothetical protein